ncbi:choice-of-anchor B family protein [candidate division GN15 bacterium]|nr:choice-of-anchor B family protein [candidate division GN15 bacterium]
MTNGSRIGVRAAFTGLACLLLFASIGLAIPPGYDGPLDFETRPGEEGDNSRMSTIASAGEKAAGDTVFSLCAVGVIEFQPQAGGSDCWGWEAPDGTEYAIMGTYDGISFVNANTMQIIQTVPGPTNGCGSVRWRDMVTMGNYCYAVSECSGTNQGIMIIDMSFLPDSVSLVTSYSSPTDPTSHNIAIDTATGYAYAVKRFYNGVRIINLNNPTAPVELNYIPTSDCHDMFARNDTLWIAEGSGGTWSAWDVSNKSNPQLIRRVAVPNSGYVHNIWPSGDGQYVITTEETSFKTVKYWDVSDYNNVQLVGQYLAPSDLAHNAHMIGDTAFISHYESGVSVVDFSDPSVPSELARYDTYDSGESPGFNGAWGAFPYTTSGKVYGSNGDNRLFIMERRSVITTDTIFGDTVLTNPDEQVAVDVLIDNHTPLSGINIPFTWTGPFGLTIDSVSTEGLRTDYFNQKTFTVYDPGNQRAAYAMIKGTDQPALPPGDGPILRIFFSVPPGASGAENLIDFSAFAQTQPEVMAACLQFTLETSPAVVKLGAPSCCEGGTGNINDDPGDNVDLPDVIYLVNSLFLGGPQPPCPEEANVNGDVDGNVDLPDVIYLVNALFLGGSAPSACP